MAEERMRLEKGFADLEEVMATATLWWNLRHHPDHTISRSAIAALKLPLPRRRSFGWRR